MIGPSTTSPLPVVFICGAGRSGSTLLEMLLRPRLDVFAGGEMRQIWGAGLRRNARCECGMPFAECSLWRDATEHLRLDPDAARRTERHGQQLLRVRNMRRLLGGPTRWSLGERVFAESTWRVYENAAAASSARAVLDSSKTALYALLLAANPAFDVHVIHLTRDPRAVAYSWQRQKVWRASTRSPGETKHMRQRSPSSVARIWLVQNALALSLSRHVESYQRLRYEQIVEAPDRMLDDITSRLPPDLTRSPSSERVEHHGFMGNPMRFDGDRPEVRADETWRTELSRVDHFVVTALTAPGLLRFGYRPRHMPTTTLHAPE